MQEQKEQERKFRSHILMSRFGQEEQDEYLKSHSYLPTRRIRTAFDDAKDNFITSYLFIAVYSISTGIMYVLQTFGVLPMMYQRVAIRAIQTGLLSGFTLLWYNAKQNHSYYSFFGAVGFLILAFIIIRNVASSGTAPLLEEESQNDESLPPKVESKNEDHLNAFNSPSDSLTREKPSSAQSKRILFSPKSMKMVVPIEQQEYLFEGNFSESKETLPSLFQRSKPKLATEIFFNKSENHEEPITLESNSKAFDQSFDEFPQPIIMNKQKSMESYKQASSVGRVNDFGEGSSERIRSSIDSLQFHNDEKEEKVQSELESSLSIEEIEDKIEEPLHLPVAKKLKLKKLKVNNNNKKKNNRNRSNH